MPVQFPSNAVPVGGPFQPLLTKGIDAPPPYSDNTVTLASKPSTSPTHTASIPSSQLTGETSAMKDVLSKFLSKSSVGNKMSTATTATFILAAVAFLVAITIAIVTPVGWVVFGSLLLLAMVLHSTTTTVNESAQKYFQQARELRNAFIDKHGSPEVKKLKAEELRLTHEFKVTTDYYKEVKLKEQLKLAKNALDEKLNTEIADTVKAQAKQHDIQFSPLQQVHVLFEQLQKDVREAQAKHQLQKASGGTKDSSIDLGL